MSHTADSCRETRSGVHTPDSEELSPHSRPGAYSQASKLVADLHQRELLDLPALLRELIEGAVELVPGAQYAGVTVTTRRASAESASATHRYPLVVNEIQNRCRQGPSVAAATTTEDSVLIDDLAVDERWPLYRQEVLKQTPIRSVLSLAMLREGTTAATLSFYAESTHAFDGDSVDMGLMFATHAALVWNMMRRDQQFRAALVSRDIIGQAKGRLMERFNIDAAEAFEMLKLISQDSNTPLAVVARGVVVGDSS